MYTALLSGVAGAVLLVLLSACDQRSMEGDLPKKEISTVSPEQATVDPVEVSPDMYRVLFENDHVRMVEHTASPGQKDYMHSHPAFAWYVLEGEKLQVSTPDGLIRAVTLKPGGVRFFDPVPSHATENTGDVPLKILMVELKEELADSVSGPDPVAVSAETHRLVGEDDAFRVLEMILKPGEKHDPHSHPGSVLYALRDATALLHIEREAQKPVRFSAGNAMYLAPGQTYQMENTGSTEIRLIMFELKRLN